MTGGPQFFKSAAGLRRWFQVHHAAAAEVVIGFHKKASGKGGITYAEALDEALCFGWIDGVRKGLDSDSYTIRFTPRTKRSFWSAVNTKRAGELIADGRMTPTGLRVFQDRDPERTWNYSYERQTCELDAVYVRRFRKEKGAWAFFESQPPSYRRTACWYVMSAKRPATRERRLEQLIASCAAGRRLDQLAPGK